jgi:3-oxoacyl-(acyl-carrier-protein) synthase
MMNNNIVITGEGIVCAIGQDKPSVLDSLQHKHSGIGTMQFLRSCHKELPVGEVPLSNDDMRNLLGVKDTLINRTTLMGMLAVRQALEDAGIPCDAVKEKPLRLVLISGTTVAGMDITEDLFDQFSHSDAALQCLRYHSAGASTRLIAEYFDIFAEYTTISTACSSAANALMLGARMLTAGEADIVVAGGAEALSLFHLNGFRSLMILDHEPCRPFDATRAGLNLGEGAAFLVMETEEGARRRGVTPHAYLTGYGNACDAFHQTASSDNGEGAYLAMTEALQMAGLKPSDIQYVNAHGTGTPNNDLSESMALKRVFGENMPLVSSTKSFTGHTTSASGSIESVICLLALQHQFVPANLGWSQAIDGGIVPTMGEDHCHLQHVVCNSFGFGGNDTSLVFSLSRNDNCDATLSKRELEIGNDAPCVIKELARVEITSEDQLAEIRDYVKPLEARRMGKIMKSSLLSSLKALRQAGIEQPDAIITGTALGCLENSELLLRQMVDEGETMLKPTYFMQSTHNTISSNIAIRLGCHGYNITYTQDQASFDWAIRDAELLLKSGKCKTVLVGCHDESTPLYRQLMQRLGYDDIPSVNSKAIVLSCGK